MSSNFDKKKDTIAFYHHGTVIDPVSEKQIVKTFDIYASQDAQEIETNMKETKLYKKLCLIKTILSPIELSLTWILMEKSFFKDKMKLQNLFWRFLRNRVDLERFKREMSSHGVKQ